MLFGHYCNNVFSCLWLIIQSIIQSQHSCWQGTNLSLPQGYNMATTISLSHTHTHTHKLHTQLLNTQMCTYKYKLVYSQKGRHRQALSDWNVRGLCGV